MTKQDSTEYRAGFISIVGRPNVGKSTLINALVGHKIAITSNRPQTTRHIIRGIVHREDGQLILVDTPGIHRPKKLLGNYLNALVDDALTDVDIIAMCFPVNEKIGPGDRFILDYLSRFPKAKKVALVTKIDAANRDMIMTKLIEVDMASEAMSSDWEHIIPISSVTEEGLDIVVDELMQLLPISEQLYPDEMITETRPEQQMAEIIREAALESVHEELPHSIAVTIDEVVDSTVYVSLWVERDSQKGIIIGKGGSHLKEIGTRARQEINRVLETTVHLNIQVKVAPEWQKDPKLLNKLGFSAQF